MTDQPVGESLPGWTPPPRPHRAELSGRLCTITPLAVDRHAPALWDAFRRDVNARNWTYLGNGPFDTFGDFVAWLRTVESAPDPQFYSIVVHGIGAAGLASYLRINPDAGSIEVGHIHLSPLLQHTTAATEAMFLMMREVFALGYRRYEWKCDALNAASRAAAERLGFTFEGIFRQALVYKGRNRDTAWYSIIDKEWPPLRAGFERWLAPGNFDTAGRQRERLSDCFNSARMARSRA